MQLVAYIKLILFCSVSSFLHVIPSACRFHHCVLMLCDSTLLSFSVSLFVVWNLFSCSCCCLIFCVSFQVIPSLFLHEVDLQVILYLCRLQLGWNAWCWHLVFFSCVNFLLILLEQYLRAQVRFECVNRRICIPQRDCYIFF